ncbi:hypothetical protein GPJ56_010049 [Histomonas meleagridis]|uniref:uncharacterized protein n=1 Tax=Histomonas meleagridis TaxID=135588 RepID=UPI0035594379|nr:hypothetical protein GPJ56_010049 [Histomonas meleagridis]KAH0800094.1 hypothetical protein GO595_007206 [Histomonas meleagridis]
MDTEADNLNKFKKSQLIEIIGNLNNEIFDLNEKIIQLEASSNHSVADSPSSFLANEEAANLKSSEHEISEYIRQINQLQADNDQFKIQINFSTQKNEELQSAIKKLNDKIDAYEKQIKELKNLNDDLESQIQASTRTVIDSEQLSLEQLISKLQNCELELSFSKSENEKLKAELQNSREKYISEITRLSQSFKEIHSDQTIIDQNTKASDEQIAFLQSKVYQLEENYRILSENFQQSTNDNAQLSRSVQHSQEELQSLTKELENSNGVLQQLRSLTNCMNNDDLFHYFKTIQNIKQESERLRQELCSAQVGLTKEVMINQKLRNQIKNFTAEPININFRKPENEKRINEMERKLFEINAKIASLHEHFISLEQSPITSALSGLFLNLSENDYNQYLMKIDEIIASGDISGMQDMLSNKLLAATDQLERNQKMLNSIFQKTEELSKQISRLHRKGVRKTYNGTPRSPTVPLSVRYAFSPRQSPSYLREPSLTKSFGLD